MQAGVTAGVLPASEAAALRLPSSLKAIGCARHGASLQPDDEAARAKVRLELASLTAPL